jgi:hypothetical protein
MISRMAECGERATLIITRSIEGTSTTIAQQRLALTCALERGHAGAHQDPKHGESWESPGGRLSTLLRHEETGEGRS